jgi:hypothetical protein
MNTPEPSTSPQSFSPLVGSYRPCPYCMKQFIKPDELADHMVMDHWWDRTSPH